MESVAAEPVEATGRRPEPPAAAEPAWAPVHAGLEAWLAEWQAAHNDPAWWTPARLHSLRELLDGGAVALAASTDSDPGREPYRELLRRVRTALEQALPGVRQLAERLAAQQQHQRGVLRWLDEARKSS